MRLWHQALIPYLDNKRLLGQHRECCALRGKGWGKRHSVVDYVFTYDLAHLYAYHIMVMAEMTRRGYNIHGLWGLRTYRGKNVPASNLNDVGAYVHVHNGGIVYAEHNDKYLKECLLNLKSKGAELVNGKNIDAWLIELDLKGNAV